MLGGLYYHSSTTATRLRFDCDPEVVTERVQEPIAKAGNLSGAEKSVAHWLVNAKAQLPPLRFDCGVDDTLIEHNRKFGRALPD